MSLRYTILAETVLKALARDFPIFGNPETREEASRVIHQSFAPAKPDVENRDALREAAIGFAKANTQSAEGIVGRTSEFYAINLLSIELGAITKVTTLYVSIPESVPLDMVEKFFKGRDRCLNDDAAALSINVELTSLPDDVEITFLDTAAEGVFVKGILRLGALRRRAAVSS